MALIVFIMGILAAQFGAGLDAFRQLKGIGDMNEKLRESVTVLRRDLQDTNRLSSDYIRGGLQTGSVDLKQAGFLRLRYQTIVTQSEDIEAQLRKVEEDTTNPAAKKILNRSLDDLCAIKEGAKQMVLMLGLLL